MRSGTAFQFHSCRRTLRLLHSSLTASPPVVNLEGAKADYTAVIEMEGALADQRAKALYNRGVATRAAGDLEGAKADWRAVIEMEDAPDEVKRLAEDAIRRMEQDG